MPLQCTEPLTGPLKKDLLTEGVKEIEYDGKCMNAPRAMLDFLHAKVEESHVALKESITPVLSVLCKLCRHNRFIRKYFRSVILPPLRDLTNRPEVGVETRNRLCKLLTSPVNAVSQIVAEFLFILCKESGKKRLF